MCQLHAPDQDALDLHAVPDTAQYMMSLTSLDQIQMEVRQLEGLHLRICLSSADGCHFRSELCE